MSRVAEAVYRFLFRVWRPGRSERFKAFHGPSGDDVVLDVGGTRAFWMEAAVPFSRLDLLNVYTQPEDAALPGVRCLTGDGCQLPFADGSYTLAVSNSVIEHVGDWDRQQAFAREIRRVGDGIWVQTPAKEFPVEPHFLAVYVQYLPWWLRRFVCRWLTPRSWIDHREACSLTESEHGVRLLTRREMEILFPDCELLTEQFGGLAKAYIAARPRRRSDPRCTHSPFKAE